MLAEAGNGHEALSWARAYEATVSLLPDKDYVAALVHVLKYPTTATDIRYPTADELASATEHLRRKLAERFPDAAELKNGSFQQCVDWIAKRYPEIDLTSAPVRPQLS